MTGVEPVNLRRRHQRHRLHLVQPLFRLLQIVGSLVSQPALRAAAQGDGETYGDLGRHAPAPVDNLRQGLAAHAYGPRRIRNACAHRVEPESLDDLARMGWIVYLHGRHLSTSCQKELLQAFVGKALDHTTIDIAARTGKRIW